MPAVPTSLRQPSIKQCCLCAPVRARRRRHPSECTFACVHEGLTVHFKLYRCFGLVGFNWRLSLTMNCGGPRKQRNSFNVVFRRCGHEAADHIPMLRRQTGFLQRAANPANRGTTSAHFKAQRNRESPRTSVVLSFELHGFGA